MNSLFNVRFNWSLFAVVAILIFLIFPQLSWYSYFALVITWHQFLILFYSIGYVIPIRYLFGAFMCLYMLLGPVLAYNGLDEYQNAKERMQFSESEYFSYVIPAVICFIAGLHFRSNNLSGERVEQREITKHISDRKDLPYVLIATGFIAGLIPKFFPSNLAFLFYLLDGFKFIGVFMLIMGNVNLKIAPFLLVLGSVIISTLAGGMFYDLLTWIIFLGVVLALR